MSLIEGGSGRVASLGRVDVFERECSNELAILVSRNESDTDSTDRGATVPGAVVFSVFVNCDANLVVHGTRDTFPSSLDAIITDSVFGCVAGSCRPPSKMGTSMDAVGGICTDRRSD